jgi:hypothetical protein
MGAVACGDAAGCGCGAAGKGLRGVIGGEWRRGVETPRVGAEIMVFGVVWDKEIYLY